MVTASPPHPGPSRLRRVMQVLLIAVGVGICVLLYVELRSDTLQRTLWAMATYLPALLAIEAGRFAAELVSSRLVLSPRGPSPVPLSLLLRAQCVAHACNKVLPAGRAAGEAFKAALLVPYVGVGRAAGVGAAAQVMTLLVNGFIALLAGAWVAGVMGSPREAAILGVYGALGLGVGLALLLSLRSAWLMSLLRRFRRTAKLEVQLMALAQSGAGFGFWALFFHALAKVAQTAQLALLLSAVGLPGRLDLALVAEGIQIVGAAAGDLLPAQLGATEGAFTLAAPLLGISEAEGLSVAVVLHGTQLLFAGLCVLGALLLRLAKTGSAVKPAAIAAE